MNPVLPAMRGYRLASVWSVLLGTFLVLVLFLARLPLFSPIVNHGIGPAFALLVFLFFWRSGRSLPPEMLLYGAFVLWNLTGLLVARDTAFFWSYFALHAQVFILGCVVVLVVGRLGDLRPVFGALAATAVFALGNTLHSRELLAVIAVRENVQVAGLLKNPNGFGFAMLVGIMGLLFFWYRARSHASRLMLAGLSGLMGVGLIYSASRKAYLTCMLFLVLWALFCHRQYLRRHPSTVLGIFVLGLALAGATHHVLRTSYLGDRLMEFRTLESIETKETRRLTFYREGLAMFLENPLFGVGLGNFKTMSVYGTYSHSDLLEVLSTTGAVGFLLYGGGIYLLWRRLRRLRRLAANPEADYEATFMQILLACYLLIGLGRPHFLDIFSVTFYAAIVGWAFYHSRLAGATRRLPSVRSIFSSPSAMQDRSLREMDLATRWAMNNFTTRPGVDDHFQEPAVREAARDGDCHA
jgi:O-antigen ligase